eukprot:m.41840 g.41840  ORF g.41840 m.41840 type:complete len:201 (-) comp11864_c0_seq1:310-912(-)
MSLHILVGCTGSVASVKVPELVEKLSSASTADGRSIQVRVVATKYSMHFFDRDKIGELHTDADEWAQWQSMGDPVLHIELRKWAHIFLLAPLDANTLAKISTGLCDNLLTCIARAWNFKRPMIVCPAMNTLMWQHPITASQLTTLRTWGVDVVEPISKRLACGDTGAGALASVDTIVAAVLDAARDVDFSEAEPNQTALE